MADSTLNVDKIQNRFGTGPVDLIGQSAAKAWLNSNGVANLNSSFNISSGTDNGTGDYTFVFTNNFDANVYPLQANASTNLSARFANGTMSNSQDEVGVWDDTGSRVDNGVDCTNYGTLA